MQMLEHFLAFLCSFGLLGVALVLRRISHTWATPACLFCLFWFLFTVVPLMALPSAPVNPLAVLYILAGSVAFAAPALLNTDWPELNRRNARNAAARQGLLSSPLIRRVFWASLLVSIVFIFIDLVTQGISFEQMLFNFFESSNKYLELRYEGEIEINPFGQWGLIAAYLCVVFGGFVHACGGGSTTYQRVVLLGAMLPSVLIMLVQAAKGLFFLSIACVLGAHWLCRVLQDVRPHVDLRALLRNSRYLLIAAPFVVMSFLSRGLHASDDTDYVLNKLFGYLVSYAFSHMYAFSDWFSFWTGQPSLTEFKREPLTWGFTSLIAVFRLFGDTRFVPPGVFDEYFAWGEFPPGNLYTIFRGLIQDFGIIGSWLVLLALGAVFNAGYRAMLRSARPALSIALMLAFVQILYTSYLVSALIWNTTFAALVLMALVLVLNRRNFTPHNRELHATARRTSEPTSKPSR